MKSVLIAGAGGFVGRSLVETLLASGHKISVFTRDPAKTVSGTKAVPIKEWLPGYIEESRVATERFDWVFNLTAYGVDPRETDSDRSVAANSEMPLVLLRIAEQVGASAFVHVGSAFEYREPRERRPIREDDPLEADKLYGRTKAAGSLAVTAMAAKARVHAIVARLFGVYGARERPWRLLPNLYSRLSKGEGVPLTEGLQERDFIYVKDAAGGLIALAEALEKGNCEWPVVNLCSGTAVTVRKFSETVADMLGASHELLHFGEIPMRSHEIPYLVGNVSRLHATTSWRPKFDLDKGIKDACAELASGIKSD